MIKRIFLATLLLGGCVSFTWSVNTALPAQPDIPLPNRAILSAATYQPGTVDVSATVPISTLTPTPNCGFTLFGLVSNTITSQGIAGARVEVSSGPRLFSTTTAADGTYSLPVPYVYACMTTKVGVSATGYQGASLFAGWQELSAQPHRDFALLPLGATMTITPSASASTCQVRYTIQSQWSNGFVANLTVKNLGAMPISGWTLAWTFSGNQTITSMWNANYIQIRASISARDVGWNKLIAPGGMVSFGFLASYSGINGTPGNFALNGQPCAIDPNGAILVPPY